MTLSIGFSSHDCHTPMTVSWKGDHVEIRSCGLSGMLHAYACRMYPVQSPVTPTAQASGMRAVNNLHIQGANDESTQRQSGPGDGR
jgi:hypothetical protein